MLDAITFQSSLPNVFFGGDSALGPKNIITAVAQGHEAAISIDAFCHGDDPRDRPPPMTNLVSQKMGIHEWSYDNAIALDTRYAVPHVDKAKALRDLKTEVELGFTLEQALAEARRCLNCDVETVFSAPACIECDACVDICPIDCISFVENAPSRRCASSERAGAQFAIRRSMSRRRSGRARDGEGRGRLPALRPLRRTLSHRGLGHAKICDRGRPGGECMSIHAVNDFVIRFANVNGSGSASANLMFAKSIMRMGVPIAPRNIFPSNIQGLPTWYEVRVSGEGRLGARGGVDMLVAMNPQTFAQDIAGIDPGGYLFYDSTRPLQPSQLRDDLTVIGMPLTEICAGAWTDPKQRQLYKNIVYVGALAALLDIDERVLETLIGETFRAKDKLIAANLFALQLGYREAKARFDCPLPLRIRRSDAVGDRILVEGNFAAGLGAVYGGATVCAWYPITPSTSLAEAYERNCLRYRIDPATGKKNFAHVQAEDEIAAIGMAIGAGWNGARAFTATSGPGISLMQEFFGLAYFAEVPVVVFDVQRGGPSTGMPTRTQQSDLLACAFASHGDTKHVLLIPDGPGEAFEFAASAFDLAERLQTPIFVMLDLDIGMNSRLTKPFRWDDSRTYDRGKVLSHDDLERAVNFGRYNDVDGDGIPYRTLPGKHPTRGAYFTRGTSRDRFARYTEDSAPYVENMERLEHKFETARSLLPPPQRRRAAGPARVGVIYYGSTAPAMDEALDLIAAQGVEVDALRIRAFPLNPEIGDFVHAHDEVFVVEQNRDAQMRTLMAADLNLDPGRLISILHFGGAPITARFIVREICSRLPSRARKEPSRPYRDLSRQAEVPPPRDRGQRARPHASRL